MEGYGMEGAIGKKVVNMFSLLSTLYKIIVKFLEVLKYLLI